MVKNIKKNPFHFVFLRSSFCGQTGLELMMPLPELYEC